MRRWLLLIAVLVLAFVPSALEAATTQYVQIRATGYICAAPGGFTLTYVSDYEVGISWAKGIDANNTMVRAAYGRLPESRTDGYLVYYGNGTYCNDTAINFEETASQIYYRAWSQNSAGLWEETGASDWIEGAGMKLIAFIILPLALFAMGWAFKRQFLFMAAGMAWVAFAFYMRTLSSAVGWTNFDFYMLLFWLGVALALVSFIETWLVARVVQEQEEVKDSLTTRAEQVSEQMRRIQNIRRTIRGE